MKGSITKRLFLYILLTIVGFTVLILLSNSLLLQPLYYKSLKSTMVSAMNEVADIDYSQDVEDWVAELSELNQGKSFGVVILIDDIIVLSTSNEFGLRKNSGQVNDDIERPMDDGLRISSEWGTLEELDENTSIGLFSTPDSDSEIELMVCIRSVDENTMIMLTQPVEPINQSVVQANVLLLVCAGVALVIFSIFAFRISKGFTRPIRQIQTLVGEMARLNFTQRCDVQTGDELENLATDVNSLGDELESALLTLKKQNAQLEADVKAQKQFISNASHELRTPLSLIKGYADEMNTGFVTEQAQRQAYTEIIALEANKMNRLLKEMLALSRMESGRVQMQNETLSVGEMIQSFVDKYDGFIAENGLDVQVTLTDNDMGVFDPMRFEQVLANYFSNAARYSDAQKRVEISTKAVGESIRVSVFNTGNAIPKEKLQNLWDGFYKGDDARMRVEDSYGLGLSIVKAIQAVAGQGYGVKNVDGGVTFWFDVNRAE